MKCAPVVHYLLMERAFDPDKNHDMGGARANFGVVALWTANTKRCHFGEDTGWLRCGSAGLCTQLDRGRTKGH